MPRDPIYNIDFRCNTVMAKSSGSCQMSSSSDTSGDVMTETNEDSFNMLSTVISWIDIGCLCLILIGCLISCLAYYRLLENIKYIWLNLRRFGQKKVYNQTQTRAHDATKRTQAVASEC